MLRLLTNVITDSGKAVMDGAFWECTSWFWQTNWLIFEVWLLVFIVIMMYVVSMFTAKPTSEQIAAITFTGDYKKAIREKPEYVGCNCHIRRCSSLRIVLCILLVIHKN